MKKYICEPCGYEYDPAIGDPDGGIAPGTAFEDIPGRLGMSSLRIRKRRIRSRRRLITHFRQTPYRSPESVFYFWKTSESIPRPGAQPTSGTGMVSSHSDTKPILPDSYAASRCNRNYSFPAEMHRFSDGDYRL